MVNSSEMSVVNSIEVICNHMYDMHIVMVRDHLSMTL